jgi:hypothetical protein
MFIGTPHSSYSGYGVGRLLCYGIADTRRLKAYDRK